MLGFRFATLGETIKCNIYIKVSRLRESSLRGGLKGRGQESFPPPPPRQHDRRVHKPFLFAYNRDFKGNGREDCKTVSFFSRFSVVLSLWYWCVMQECVTHESREATKGEFLASLSSPTRNFHARSRSLMIRFQPKKEQVKIQTVLQSNGRAIRAERERGRGGGGVAPSPLPRATLRSSTRLISPGLFPFPFWRLPRRLRVREIGILL